MYVNVVRRAFSYDFVLNKWVMDLETDIVAPAPIWRSGGLGIYPQTKRNILQILSQAVDEFISQYLAVNESACE